MSLILARGCKVEFVSWKGFYELFEVSSRMDDTGNRTNPHKNIVVGGFNRLGLPVQISTVDKPEKFKRRYRQNNLFGFKSPVDVFGLRPATALGILICRDASFDLKLDCIVTACKDGTHSRWSEHNEGDAWDRRTNNIKPKMQMTLMKETVLRLGGDTGDYQVLLESDHMHCQRKAQRQR